MNKNIYILIALGLVVLGGYYFFTLDQPTNEITNFEECIAAGNPVMESFPEQCRTEDGQNFVRDVSSDERTPTSADNTPPGSIHNLPVPDAVAAVRSHVAQEFNLNEGVVILLTAFEKQWPDGCLGVASSEEMCIQVITPGYEVKVMAVGKEFVYRTNADGSVIRAAN